MKWQSELNKFSLIVKTALYGVSFYLLGDFTNSNVSLHN